MKKRGGYLSRIPLEWRTQAINVTDTTTVNPSTAEIDLDLLDDEVAEIWNIHTYIDPGTPGEADNSYQAGLLLSLDPDADDSPIVNANLLDIETFYYQRYSAQFLLTTSGIGYAISSQEKQWNAAGHPILVGTNIGMVVEAESTVDRATDFLATVYFKRRKASDIELAQILLKRR